MCPLSPHSDACPPHEPPSCDVPPPSCNMASFFLISSCMKLSFSELHLATTSLASLASTATFYRCSSLYKILWHRIIPIMILAKNNNKLLWLLQKLTETKTCLTIVIVAKTMCWIFVLGSWSGEHSYNWYA